MLPGTIGSTSSSKIGSQRRPDRRDVCRSTVVAGNLSNVAGTGVLEPCGRMLPAFRQLRKRLFQHAGLRVPAPGQFGNAGRNTIEGPGLFSVNASFGRPFTFGERKVFEFRFDVPTF